MIEHCEKFRVLEDVSVGVGDETRRGTNGLACTQVERRAWRLRGRVQGVGFRPFVYRLAVERSLGGFVRNDRSGVTIEAEGSARDLGHFEDALQSDLPPLAKIEQVSRRASPPRGDQAFRILPSLDGGAADAEIAIDTAVCDACVSEMLDPADRRFGYGLINCTECGPRFSIIRHVPYDRPATTMKPFDLCVRCDREYTSPADRRFHAQPTACHDCGPSLELVDSTGRPRTGSPIQLAARMLREGRILAIKGLGGFHLAVRADDARAVARLRSLKQRDTKPFALMCRTAEDAQTLASISSRGLKALTSPRTPIVLATRRSGTRVAEGVAPGTHRLGVMLPYTPIQHLLFAEREVTPAVLVMTSGNVAGEPLAIENPEALSRLGPLCDALLWHDREIARAVDDSIVIDRHAAEPLPVRRARGFVPTPIELDEADGTSDFAPDGLCVGGELKSTVAVVRGAQAILSQHLGDLKHPIAFQFFKNAIDDLQELFEVEPRWIAHDLHPQYLSTCLARSLGSQLDVPLIGVQHHHAHAAAVLAEHGERGPAIAIVCDGVGYGVDGTIWGGEILLADLVDFRRMARLRPLQLPGGDAAATDTRRCAMGLLLQAFGDHFGDHPAALGLGLDYREHDMLVAMTRRGIQCARSSAAGRVFDGVTALLGLGERNEFEAQAGMRLESAASLVPRTELPSVGQLFALRDDPAARLRQIDLSALVRHLVRPEVTRGGIDAVNVAAAVFHDQLAAALAAAAAEAAQETGVDSVVLSGGVFLNERLAESVRDRLTRRSLRVLEHRLVPPGDGGLSLGQAAVARARSRVRAGVSCLGN